MAEGIGPQERNQGESLQVRAPVILAVMAGLLALLVAVGFGFMLVFPNRVGVRFVPRQAFPPPAVTPDEGRQRRALEAGQRRALAGAGGRMPITAAMAAIAARGDRAFDPLEP